VKSFAAQQTQRDNAGFVDIIRKIQPIRQSQQVTARVRPESHHLNY
jgi:hypothetical protein